MDRTKALAGFGVIAKGIRNDQLVGDITRSVRKINISPFRS